MSTQVTYAMPATITPVLTYRARFKSYYRLARKACNAEQAQWRKRKQFETVSMKKRHRMLFRPTLRALYRAWVMTQYGSLRGRPDVFLSDRRYTARIALRKGLSQGNLRWEPVTKPYAKD